MWSYSLAAGVFGYVGGWGLTSWSRNASDTELASLLNEFLENPRLKTRKKLVPEDITSDHLTGLNFKLVVLSMKDKTEVGKAIKQVMKLMEEALRKQEQDAKEASKKSDQVFEEKKALTQTIKSLKKNNSDLVKKNNDYDAKLQELLACQKSLKFQENKNQTLVKKQKLEETVIVNLRKKYYSNFMETSDNRRLSGIKKLKIAIKQNKKVWQHKCNEEKEDMKKVFAEKMQLVLNEKDSLKTNLQKCKKQVEKLTPEVKTPKVKKPSSFAKYHMTTQQQQKIVAKLDHRPRPQIVKKNLYSFGEARYKSNTQAGQHIPGKQGYYYKLLKQ